MIYFPPASSSYSQKQSQIQSFGRGLSRHTETITRTSGESTKDVQTTSLSSVAKDEGELRSCTYETLNSSLSMTCECD